MPYALPPHEVALALGRVPAPAVPPAPRGLRPNPGRGVLGSAPWTLSRETFEAPALADVRARLARAIWAPEALRLPALARLIGPRALPAVLGGVVPARVRVAAEGPGPIEAGAWVEVLSPRSPRGAWVAAADLVGDPSGRTYYAPRGWAAPGARDLYGAVVGRALAEGHAVPMAVRAACGVA